MNNTKTNNLRKMGGVTALLASTLAFANSVEAISLIGNYTPANDDAGNSISSISPSQKAVGFALPTGTSYELNNIILRLSNYNTDTVALGGSDDVAVLEIYAGGTTSPSGATLQSVTFNKPISSSDIPSNVSFTPTSPFTFDASTRYWLVVRAIDGDDYNWTADSSNIEPTGISSFEHYALSNNNGGSYTANETFSSFTINATAVPFEFEATGGLVMLGGAWLLHKHLQKKKT